MRTGTQQSLNERIPGLYRMYRRSAVVPDKFLLGRTLISYDDISGAIRTEELFRYRYSERKGVISSRPVKVEYHGHIVKKSDKYYLLAKDESFNLRMTVLTDVLMEHKLITIMRGVVVGILGNRSFSNPIYYERYDGDENELCKQINAYDRDVIPEIVLNYLERK